MTVPALSASRLVLSPDAIAKARLRAIDRDRASVRTRTAAMAGDMAAFLAALGAKVAAQITDVLGAQKQRRPGGEAMSMEEAARRAAAALERLDIDDEWEALVSVLEPHLRGMAEDGGRAALTQLAVDDDGVTALMVGRTTKWARARAAEMVGMRRRDDGSLAPNPNAKWRIDESTRDMVRSLVMDALQSGSSTDEIASRLVESAAFSATRAEMVARTEMANADMAGAMDGYRVSGLVAGKRWSTSNDDLVSEECLACEAAGVIGLDDMFPTGVYAPPNHPNCRCTVLPVLTDEMPAAGKTTKGRPMPKIIWSGAHRDALRLSFPITKSERLDDGRMMIEGVATSEALDSDGEVIDYDAAKAAFATWAGNIREQHDAKKAVGRAVDVVADDDARSIRVTAFISAGAADTQAKIMDGTLSSFSIGGSVRERVRERVKSADGADMDAQRVFIGRLSELSVVDVGANPDTGLQIARADGADEDDMDDIRKYAGEEIADAATAIQALHAIFCLLAKEQQDAMEPPEQIEALKAVVASLKRFIASEIGETSSDVQRAAGAGELQKAGKRFSATTKAALRAAHEACRAADKALADLGYDSDEDEDEGDDAGKADTGADLQKPDADTAEITEIAKTVGLEIAEPTATALTKAALSELLTLRKAHADLLASPAAPKGVAKAVAISKAADRGEDETDEPAPVVKSDGSTDDVATLVKAAQSRPIRLA